MKVACLLALAAVADAGRFTSLFSASPTRPAGLEPSAGHLRSTLRKKLCDDEKEAAKAAGAEVGAADGSLKAEPAKAAVDVQAADEGFKAEAIKTASFTAEPAKTAIHIQARADDLLNRTGAKHAPSAKAAANASEPAVDAEPKRRAQRSFEGNLIHSLRFMGDHGEEAVDCVTTCRYGEIRHEWRQCLERCVENPLMRSTFMSMLPKEDHKAHAEHIEVPEELLKRQRHKRQRSSEL